MCQLGAETAQQNEEWMYQLDRDQSTKDPVQRLVEGEIAFEDMARQDMTELQQLQLKTWTWCGLSQQEGLAQSVLSRLTILVRQ